MRCTIRMSWGTRRSSVRSCALPAPGRSSNDPLAAASRTFRSIRDSQLLIDTSSLGTAWPRPSKLQGLEPMPETDPPAPGDQPDQPEGPPPQPRPRAYPPRLAAALVFFASGAVLVLEIVALRLVAPYVGITLQTNTAVIGVALAAIATGAWAGGRVADTADPRRLVPGALVFGGVATMLTLPLVRVVGPEMQSSDPLTATALAFIGVFAPSAFLAAVTPMVVKLQLADLRRTGSIVGRLSGIGTLGAILATFATGFVLVAALPSSVIVVGLGLLALQIDGGVIAFDRAHLALGNLPGLTIDVGDARVHLAGEPSAGRDLVIGDAFGGLAVPWHLTTREVVAQLSRILRPDGIYAVNVIDFPPNRFVRAEVATIASVFPNVAIIADPASLAGSGGGNFVVVASASPLPLDAVRARLAQRRSSLAVAGGDAVARFAGDAMILRDDYAPVDQLITHPPQRTG